MNPPPESSIADLGDRHLGRRRIVTSGGESRLYTEQWFLLRPNLMVNLDRPELDVMAEAPEETDARTTTNIWFKPRDYAQRVAEFREAAGFCLEFTFCDWIGPGGIRAELMEEQLEFVKGRGAPARRIIGLSGTWRWPWPFPVWVQEQAARNMKKAAQLRKKAAAFDTVRRRLRRGRWSSPL
jgi:hypothetical protein